MILVSNLVCSCICLYVDACGLNGARDGNSIQPVQQPRSTVIAQAQPPNPAAPITLVRLSNNNNNVSLK